MQLVCTTFSTESWRPEAGGSEKNYGRRFEAAAGVAGAVKCTANRHTAHHYAIGGVELFLLSKGNFSLSRARLVRLHFGGCFHCTVLTMKNSSNHNGMLVPSLISRFLFLLLSLNCLNLDSFKIKNFVKSTSDCLSKYDLTKLRMFTFVLAGPLRKTGRERSQLKILLN